MASLGLHCLVRWRPYGGGAGRRTTARHDCTSTNEVAYYSMVDVDLVGTWDGPYKWFSPVVEVPCYPAPKT